MKRKSLERSTAPLHVGSNLSLQRRQSSDFRGEVERAVMERWAQMNVPQSWINGGDTHMSHLCPKIASADSETLDPKCQMAINDTIQWLFGTNIGRVKAAELFNIEIDLHQEKANKQKLRA